MQLCTLLNKLFVVRIIMDLNFKTIFCDTWSRAWKTRSESRETNNPPYVENNYRIEVKITFMLIAYLVLLCEFFWEFSFFHFCRPLVDIYWHPLLSMSIHSKEPLIQNNQGFHISRVMHFVPSNVWRQSNQRNIIQTERSEILELCKSIRKSARSQTKLP